MYNWIKNKKEEEKLFKKAKNGAKFLKHGRQGKAKMRYVSISQSLDKITWKEMKKSSTSDSSNLRKTVQPLSEFTEMKRAEETKVLKRSIPSKERASRLPCCFSFIGPKRTLDLECQSEGECQEWFEIFDTVFEKMRLENSGMQQGPNKKADVDKVIAVLKKFSFDIESPQWKISKVLTKGAKFNDEDVMYLTLAMEGNPKIATIVLEDTPLSEQAVSYIASALSGTQSLTQLDLSSCGVNDEGARNLAGVLKVNKSMRTLKLANNNISDYGAQDIAYAVSVNPSLEEISLDKNGITDEAAIAIADALKGNNSLHTLTLCDNQISNDGVIQLAEVMKIEGSKLTTLQIARNPIVFPEIKDDMDDQENAETGDFSLEISLFLAVDQNNFADVILLTLKGADPNVQNEEDGKTPLHIAAMRGDMHLIEFLIEHPSIDINAVDDADTTPLFCAAHNKQYDIAKLLLNRKADFTIGDQLKQTVLHLACEQGNLPLVKMLVEDLHDDIGKITVEDVTPLHVAAQYQHKDIVEWIITHDSNNGVSNGHSGEEEEQMTSYINWQDVNGETALHKALHSSKYDIEIAQFLVSKGADPSIEDVNQRTAISDISGKHKEILLNEARKNMAAKSLR